MAYSRKRYWFVMAGLLAIGVVMVTLRIWLHAGHIELWAIALGAVCAVMSLLAYFSGDEIQRQNVMRAWYHGGLLGFMLVIVPFTVIVSNAMLEGMAGYLSHAVHLPEAALLHSHKTYFALGVLVTGLVQAIGIYVARMVLRFRS